MNRPFCYTPEMPVPPKIRPLQPILKSKPFDHRDYLFELKVDGFRGMAYLKNGSCQLVSRNDYTFRGFKALSTWLSDHLRVRETILDGEVCCLDESGKSNFNDLTLQARDPYFAVFDILWIDGEDLRHLPLIERQEAAFLDHTLDAVFFVLRRSCRGVRS
jgi:bifunctional non-homologous end joining protein LigD